MATWVWVVVAVAVVAAVAVAAVAVSKRRTALLRARLGPEYDRAVVNRDSRRAGEADQRAELEQRLGGSGSPVSTEDLRQGLRLYHSFFDRLLAA